MLTTNGPEFKEIFANASRNLRVVARAYFVADAAERTGFTSAMASAKSC